MLLTDGQTDDRKDGWPDRQMVIRMDEQTDGHKDRWTDKEA